MAFGGAGAGPWGAVIMARFISHLDSVQIHNGQARPYSWNSIPCCQSDVFRKRWSLFKLEPWISVQMKGFSAPRRTDLLLPLANLPLPARQIADMFQLVGTTTNLLFWSSLSYSEQWETLLGIFCWRFLNACYAVKAQGICSVTVWRHDCIIPKRLLYTQIAPF